MVGAVILLWQVVTNELAHSCSQDAASIMTLTRQCKGAALRLVKTPSYAQDSAQTIAWASPRLTRLVYGHGREPLAVACFWG